MTTNFFYPSLLLLFLDPGSDIRDPGSGIGKNQDPGSGINIPDPQHCKKRQQNPLYRYRYQGMVQYTWTVIFTKRKGRGKI
jgi:hypothetical protein